MTPKLELKSFICILEIHKLLVSFGIYISFGFLIFW